MHPTWQLLERHRDEWQQDTVLWIDPPEDHELVTADDGLVTLNRRLYQYTRARRFTTEDSWPEDVARVVLFYPKAKERLDWWLSQIQQHSPTAQLYVVGENNGGIKSLAKRVNAFAQVEKLDTARHCALFAVQITGDLQPSDGWRSFDHGGCHVHALPGVFSQQRLDKGTALLLDTLPTFTGRILEFGCGSGVLACDLLSRSESAHLTAVDIDWAAVTSTTRTLQDNGYEHRSRVLWSDGLTEVPKEPYDVLVTNPPFHAGIKTHYEPSERFFRECHAWLRPGGELWWVANDFLDYQSVLDKAFRYCDEKRHERGFRIFRARK